MVEKLLSLLYKLLEIEQIPRKCRSKKV